MRTVAYLLILHLAVVVSASAQDSTTASKTLLDSALAARRTAEDTTAGILRTQAKTIDSLVRGVANLRRDFAASSEVTTRNRLKRLEDQVGKLADSILPLLGSRVRLASAADSIRAVRQMEAKLRLLPYLSDVNDNLRERADGLAGILNGLVVGADFATLANPTAFAEWTNVSNRVRDALGKNEKSQLDELLRFLSDQVVRVPVVAAVMSTVAPIRSRGGRVGPQLDRMECMLRIADAIAFRQREVRVSAEHLEDDTRELSRRSQLNRGRIFGAVSFDSAKGLSFSEFVRARSAAERVGNVERLLFAVATDFAEMERLVDRGAVIHARLEEVDRAVLNSSEFQRGCEPELKDILRRKAEMQPRLDRLRKDILSKRDSRNSDFSGLGELLK